MRSCWNCHTETQEGVIEAFLEEPQNQGLGLEAKCDFAGRLSVGIQELEDRTCHVFQKGLIDEVPQVNNGTIQFHLAVGETPVMEFCMRRHDSLSWTKFCPCHLESQTGQWER